VSAAVDFAGVLASFQEPCSPRTVAVLNDYDIRVVKTKGEFTRHSHPATDEFFLVLRGSLTIRMDAGDIELGPDSCMSCLAASRTNPSRLKAPRSC
jgi:hypothetical protein